jgi:hypothetical protein
MRTTLAIALAGLSLHCKPADPGDAESSSGGSTGQITTLDPTTGGTTTLVPPTGTTEPEPTTGTVTATTTDPSTGDASTGDQTTGPVGPCVPSQCLGKTYACGDCVDNDGDGDIDLADPECISPCDDLEDTFATGLPGDNMDPCKQDCFFDGNSGNDACDWNLACDPANPGGDKCPYDPDAQCKDQTMECTDTCTVPNGCDCFGCCTVEVDGQSYDIFIGDKSCSLAKIEDCSQCTKNDDCDDECKPEECEICFGGELPPGCDDPTCDAGDPCTIDGMGGDDCADGYFCQTGCCTPLVPG